MHDTTSDSLPPASDHRPSRRDVLLVGFALVLGTVAAVLLRQHAVRVAMPPNMWFGPERLSILATVVITTALPAVHKRVSAVLDWLARPSPRRRTVIAIVLTLLAAAYLALTAHLQGRTLIPCLHDDQSYALQMRMLAEGRLSREPHPLHDFFDTFHVFVRPVYASVYFIGTSLLYVPTIWLNLPSWAMPVLVSGACVGLAYRLVTGAVDGVAGLMVAAGMVAGMEFRVFSILLTGHHPALLLGLASIWAWFRWRRSAGGRRGAWAVLIGLFSGWAAITRPADAMCFVVAVGLGILLDLWRPVPAIDGVATPQTSRRGRAMATTVALIVLGAAPFLLLQAVANKQITGSYTRSPFSAYMDRDQPGAGYGFAPLDPAARPESNVRQKRDYYAGFCKYFIRNHQPDLILQSWGTIYLPFIADLTLPSLVGVPLAFAGVLAVFCDRRLLVLAGLLPLFILIYFGYPFFLPHYTTLALVSVLLLAVLGLRRVVGLIPLYAGYVWPVTAVGWVVACLLLLPEWNPVVKLEQRVQDSVSDEGIQLLKVTEAATLQRPAVVLCRYTPGDPVTAEPVYNTDVSWPDDAPIIYAHDLAGQNWQIFEYYAERQPERNFYLWDRRRQRLTLWGKAKDLGAKLPPSP